ncbi:hypothetical protein VMCG_02162 [Cytospora schulzeri]|uniref:NADP-dependent oxidoreductase domain-containing protein n=1 Tax=Cytospora schulzeri TaxID=448051 RepID=A0A423X1M1_9PEZI|nr:hypothetical protein VMCG_02162 [Valsa malicola]
MSQPNGGTFPQFKRLPPEIRLMVWIQAYEDSKEEKCEEVCIINRPIPPTAGFPATEPDQPCVDIPFPILINFDDAMKQADYFQGHEQRVRTVAIDACLIIGLDCRKITLQVMPKFPRLRKIQVVLKSESRGVRAQSAFPPPTKRFRLVYAVPSGANKQTRRVGEAIESRGKHMIWHMLGMVGGTALEGHKVYYQHHQPLEKGAGAPTFGMDMTEFQDSASVEHILTTVRESGINRLDTAARYPPLNSGRSEQLLGEASDLVAGFSVDTKVYTDTRNDAVEVLYAHRPDPETPLEERIQAFNEQVTLGHCKAGAYNAVTRGMETKLLPILRAHGTFFVGYRVLAAGFLTGKLVNNEHADTRAGDSNPPGKAIQARFASESLHTAVKRFDGAVKVQGLTPVEVAIRWVTHHSALGDRDAAILGASKTTQIKDTIKMIRKGPLTPELVRITEDMWEDIKESRAGEL